MVTAFPYFVRPSERWEPRRYRWLVPDLVGGYGQCAGYSWTRTGAALAAVKAMRAGQ